MANNDLVKKKPVALDLDTYVRLSRFAANLRADNPGGGFVSMSAAVAVLLDGWEERKTVVESNEWNDSKVVLPALGDKLLVEFPSGKLTVLFTTRITGLKFI